MYPAPPVTTTRAMLASDGEIREAQCLHLLPLVDVAAVEADRRAHRFLEPRTGRLSHQSLEPRNVRLAELLPLGDDHQRVGVLQRVVVLAGIGDLVAEDAL